MSNVVAKTAEAPSRPVASTAEGELLINHLMEVMEALLDMGRGWGVVGPEELILFGKQLGYFERYAVGLAPDWVLGNDASLLRNIASRPLLSAATA